MEIQKKEGSLARKSNYWCCCIPLRAVCFFIGYLQLVIGLKLLIVSTAVLVYGIVLALAVHSSYGLVPYVLGTGVVTFSYTLLDLSFCVTLLAGLHQKVPAYVKVYTTYYTIVVCVAALLCIGFVGFLIWSLGSIGIVGAIQCTVGLSLPYYFLSLLRRYHIAMIQDQEMINARIESEQNSE